MSWRGVCVDQTEGPARGQPVQPDPGQADRHPGNLTHFPFNAEDFFEMDI